MTKPTLRTPEEHAAWKERRREYLREYNSRPEAKAKSKSRNDRYRSKPGIRKRDTERMLTTIAADPIRLAAKKARNANWAKLNPEKQRAWAKRYYNRKKLEMHFEEFMARLASGDMDLLS